jgi:excisionase family DNA binding protein
MNTTDVAEALGVIRQTVARWIRAGHLRATRLRVGKRATYRVRRKDFVAFVRRYVEDDWR